MFYESCKSFGHSIVTVVCGYFISCNDKSIIIKQMIKHWKNINNSVILKSLIFILFFQACRIIYLWS